MTTVASVMPILRELAQVLGEVEGVKTSRVGLEATITPEDYPIVRIVPSAIRPGSMLAGTRQTECLVYFGAPVHEFTEGMDGLYASLLGMESALIDALPRAGDWVARWVETITDEDRGEAFKMMALRVEIDG